MIKKGEIIIFPTDTAFGIGCRIDDKKSIENLFRIRNRPHDKAVPLLVSSIHMAKEYGTINTKVEELLQKFWPGGLTVVVNANQEMIPTLARGGGNTIGLRMPDHQDTLNLITQTGVPILGPSANFSGENTPYTLNDLNPTLTSLVSRIISGKTKHNIASTVLDTTQTPWKILREGAITQKELGI